MMLLGVQMKIHFSLRDNSKFLFLSRFVSLGVVGTPKRASEGAHIFGLAF